MIPSMRFSIGKGPRSLWAAAAAFFPAGTGGVVGFFGGMWFDFPTPFQRGDILIQKAPPYLHVQRPCDSLRRYFVLESLAPWDNSQMAERGFSPGELSGCEYDRIVKRLRDHGDYTDMSFLACFLEGGNLVWDNRSWYLSLERHTALSLKTSGCWDLSATPYRGGLG